MAAEATRKRRRSMKWAGKERGDFMLARVRVFAENWQTDGGSGCWLLRGQRGDAVVVANALPAFSLLAFKMRSGLEVVERRGERIRCMIGIRAGRETGRWAGAMAGRGGWSGRRLRWGPGCWGVVRGGEWGGLWGEVRGLGVVGG